MTAPAHLHELLRQLLRIRRFEERCAQLYQAEKIRGFLHLCIGEEAVAVGVMSSLRPDDAVVATYREHGHALARGLDLGPVMAEMYGKLQRCSRGRGGSMHLFDASRRFYGGNAVVHPVVHATMAGDHRVTDGHRGGLLLAAIDRLLQEPESL